LNQKGLADGLIFTGDLIHASSSSIPDKSVEIVADVLRLQAKYNGQVLYLLGNHELPHIYGFGLGKRDNEFTPAFEAALNQTPYRAEITDLFLTLPFFLRTPAGVVITHAGATPSMADVQVAPQVFTWDHEAHIAQANKQLVNMNIVGMRQAYARLSGVETYDELARHYLAVRNVNDLRYDDLLRGLIVTTDPDFEHLRSALFTKCEMEIDETAYLEVLTGMLLLLSDRYWPQRVLIAGHMDSVNGYQIIGKTHFRLASGCHAVPLQTKKYLLLNVERQIEGMEDLLNCIFSV